MRQLKPRTARLLAAAVSRGLACHGSTILRMAGQMELHIAGLPTMRSQVRICHARSSAGIIQISSSTTEARLINSSLSQQLLHTQALHITDFHIFLISKIRTTNTRGTSNSTSKSGTAQPEAF